MKYRMSDEWFLFLWPITMALVGLDVSALAFPSQTLPQIIGISIGWVVGFVTARWLNG